MSEALFDPDSLAAFPTAPGVYLMKNAKAEIIYVGKAANLRQRVRNYFTRSGDNRFSVAFLRRHVTRVEFIVTSNEKEAFLLENTLIKKHQPRYNIRLRDDKTYISLRLRMSHAYPRLEVVRVRRQADIPRGDRDYYFGPYTSASSVREILRFVLKVFPVRTCKDSVFRSRTRPCILYDVGKCCGPCVLPIPKDDYKRLVDSVVLFLRGKSEQIREMLHERMIEFSDRLEFERAAMVRDRIQALEVTLQKQQATSHGTADRDVIAVASQQGRSLIVLRQYRDGALVDSREFYLKNYEQEDSEVLYYFLSQQYSDGVLVPPEILVSVEPQDCSLLEEWLREQREGAVSLAQPQRGDRAQLVEIARTNAQQGLQRRLSGESNEEEVLREIQQKLDLPELPRNIECVDISNIMGVLAVGSLVRFEGLEPDKTGYRHFKIRTVEGSNDFAMMREVLARRFRPEAERTTPFPDLLMVDGGKGQLQIAMQVFSELGIHDVALCSIAKSRLKVRKEPETGLEGTVGRIRYRTEERIFLPNRKNPVTFATNSPALFLLQRTRDEAHRFAITYHRKLRSKANQKSVLDEIPGVGPTRKRRLLRHFGSLTAIRAAGVEELEAVEGINWDAANSIYSFLHSQVQDVETEVLEEIEEIEEESD